MVEKTNSDNIDKERAEACIIAYNALEIGFWALVQYNKISGSPNVGDMPESLERIYAISKDWYEKAYGRYPDLEKKGSVFHRFGSLSGYDSDDIDEWLIGEPVTPVDTRMWGGENTYKLIRGEIKGKSYVSGVKSLEVTQGTPFGNFYLEANNIIEDAKAAEVLMTEEITEYTLNWNKDLELVVNGVLCLTKTKEGSASSMVLEEIMKHQDDNGKTEFEPKYGASPRPLSRILNEELHIDPLLRRIFFKGSRGQKLKFRSPVSRKQLKSEGLDLSSLDIRLIKSKATTTPIENEGK